MREGGESRSLIPASPVFCGMDDPWGNAWDERAQPAAATTPKPPASPGAPSWSSPGKFGAVHDDSEADLSSWSSGGGVSWNGAPDAQGSLWGGTEPVEDAWISTTSFDQISIGKPTSDIPPAPQPDLRETRTESPISERHEVTPPASRPATPDAPSSKKGDPLSYFSQPISRPATPDGFGTFETGDATDEDTGDTAQPWLPADDNFIVAEPSSAWGAAWAKAEPEDQALEQPEDEWAAAQRQKEKLDARVVRSSHKMALISLLLTITPSSRPNCLHQSFVNVQSSRRSYALARERTTKINLHAKVYPGV